MAEKNRSQAPVKVPENWYLFKFFLLANFLQYLEAGAVPALLLNLSSDFQMDHFEQGLLGGMVYVALSCGGPIGGYLLRHCDHRNVVGSAVLLNNALTLLWSMTPIGFSFSKPLFIFVRFLMGLAQCQLVIFLPLWINEYSPNDRLTKSMGFFQVIFMFLKYVFANVICLRCASRVLGFGALWSHDGIHHCIGGDCPRKGTTHTSWDSMLAMAIHHRSATSLAPVSGFQLCPPRSH